MNQDSLHNQKSEQEHREHGSDVVLFNEREILPVKTAIVFVAIAIIALFCMVGDTFAQTENISFDEVDSDMFTQAGMGINTEEANELYNKLIANPTDRSLNLRFATLMAQRMDYEAAIPPLERILVSEPNNAWVMLQLATLYNALNSKATAQTYLYQAANEPSADDAIIDKAQQLLNSM